jgi:dTDP-4-dehydrorhamnose 3,5-epimerase
VKLSESSLQGVLIIEPSVFGDERGFFMESWKSSSYETAGIPQLMSQSNFSKSSYGVIRGLHYQHPQSQGKLVSVLEGSIFDVAVDIRWGSPNFGKWTALELTADNHLQLYVPEGFAHGFCTLSDSAIVHYMCTKQFAPEYDAAIAWNDPDIGVDWPIEPVSVSDKDSGAPCLGEISSAKLPGFET